MLYIQDTKDIIHPRADLDRFVLQYRQAEVRLSWSVEGASDGFAPGSSSHASVRALGRMYGPGILVARRRAGARRSSRSSTGRCGKYAPVRATTLARLERRAQCRFGAVKLLDTRKLTEIPCKS